MPGSGGLELEPPLHPLKFGGSSNPHQPAPAPTLARALLPAKSTPAPPLLRLQTSVVLLRSSCAPDAGHRVPLNSNELLLRWQLG